MSTLPPAYEGPLFVPAYRPAVSGRWELRVMGLGPAPGYWSGPRLIENMPALLRDTDTWMSITPLEIESQEIGIGAAAGHVLIFGLGLGWAAAATCCIPAVERVTVIEQDAEILALHDELRVFDQLPADARAKLAVEWGDAFAYRPTAPVDLLMPDIWLPLVGGDRVDDVRRMQANVAATRVYFWGQELEIARHAAAAGLALDDAGIAATVAGFGLPLVGPSLADYSARVAAAAAQWMRGRWLNPGA
ncbi:MAG: hypothetical protein ACJ8EB_02815 [Allosphingosinicella sp.]